MGAAAAATVSTGALPQEQGAGAIDRDWDAVRALFDLVPDRIHMSTMLIASHPRPVRDAIARHRMELDADPVAYLERNNNPLTDAAREAAGGYLGVHASHVALTGNTTAGVGLIYNGLVLRPGQELLVTEEDYFVTIESLRTAAARSGATVRTVALYESAAEASVDGIVSAIVAAIRPQTRLVALTWVHSSTGLKMPIAAISAALEEINADRAEEDRVLLGVDAVHGFGVESDSFTDLGCDFYMAGCHKWLFGPRGTGIVAISSRGLSATRPIIPSFSDGGVFTAWLEGLEDPPGANDGERMSPGGFMAFEHRWALPEAFQMHEAIGRDRIAKRTHDLAGMLKEGLAGLEGVAVRTPVSPQLSSGIVSFDVAGYAAGAVVSSLRERGVVASAAPYATQHVRLTPSIRNNEDDIEGAIAALQSLVG
jgi:selenocysteine lyase/cysteine desulfurase